MVVDGRFYSAHVHLPARVSRRNSPPKTLAPTHGKAIGAPTRPASVAQSVFATPPVSMPPSPTMKAAPQSNSHSSNVTKLNAAATAFVPASILTPASSFQHSSPRIMTGPSISPAPSKSTSSTSRASDKQASPVAMPAPPSSWAPISQAAVPQGQETSTSTKSPSQGYLPETSRKVNRRQPSLSMPATHVSRRTSHDSGRLQMAASALPHILDNIIDQHLRRATRRVVTEVILDIRNEEFFRQESERALVVEQCSSDLLDQILESYAEERIKAVVLQQRADRRRCRDCLFRWRVAKEHAATARLAQEESRRGFGELAHDLFSKTESRSDAWADSQDLSTLLETALDLSPTLSLATQKPVSLTSVLCSFLELWTKLHFPGTSECKRLLESRYTV